MITISLNEIRKHEPCVHGWRTLLDHLGKTQADDVRFPLTVVLDSNGLNDALWCCRCLPQYDREWRLFAVWCARQVQHLMTDQRSIDALDVAERYANGEATVEELTSARTAAGDAWYDAGATAWGDSGNVLATEWDTALAAAGGAEWDTAWDAWDASGAAARATEWDASLAAAGDAALGTCKPEQAEEFRRVCNETEGRLTNK